MDTDLENLLIYRNYVELTYYSYQSRLQIKIFKILCSPKL